MTQYTWRSKHCMMTEYMCNFNKEAECQCLEMALTTLELSRQFKSDHLLYDSVVELVIT